MRLYFISLIIIFLITDSFAQYKLINAFPELTFENPVDFQDPKDESGRVYIVTQSGIIYSVKNDPATKEKKVFLNISSKVKFGGEMGLLGLAFHPDFKNNGFFFVNYTAPNPLRTIISRFKTDLSNPSVADENSEQILLEINQPYQNHNGGGLAFGPDGYLYIGLGDGGSAGDPQNNSQNYSSLLGKMLRIDIDIPSVDKNYSIPKDNPYYKNKKGIREEIWAGGLRNPWRFSFDPLTGNLWAGDVGQNKYEEIDIIKKAGNYGWRFMEGRHCFNSSTCDSSGLELPIWEYEHNESGGFSITGGYVYRGSKMLELFGKYIYADFISGFIWALDYNGFGSTQNTLLIKSRKNISSFGKDINNEIYLCSFDGKIYKLINKAKSEASLPEKPIDWGIYHNLPNPLNQRTTIIADVKKKGQVLIEIFDGNGKKIETLIDNVLSSGRHKFLWDASAYPNGIYIYQMTAGGKKFSNKIVLIR